MTLGHDLLGHGASNPSLCLGSQVGVHLTLQGLKTMFSSSLPPTQTHGHTLSWLAVGGLSCVGHTGGMGCSGPEGRLPSDLLTKLGPREAGAQTHSWRNCGGRRGGPGPLVPAW